MEIVILTCVFVCFYSWGLYTVTLSLRIFYLILMAMWCWQILVWVRSLWLMKWVLYFNLKLVKQNVNNDEKLAIEWAFNGIVLNRLWIFVQVCPEEYFDMDSCKVFSLKLPWNHPARIPVILLRIYQNSPVKNKAKLCI